MKVNAQNINGKIMRNNETYIVEDNTHLKNLTLSKTTLYPGKCTTGHAHPGLEEVYFFKSGEGEMELDESMFHVKAGDIVLIPDGAFHKVYNNSNDNLEFVCVFQAYER